MRGVPIATPPPSFDVVTAAQAYSAFGGVLVGFALTGLFWYLTEARKDRKNGPSTEQQQRPAEHKHRPGGHERQATWTRHSDGWVVIVTRHVTLTVFYAMASLAMTSFLYASLAGEAVPVQGTSPAWAVAAMLLYGVAFGLAVLMLFYGLTLVMLERGLHREAGWAYWVVACAGPAVVLRFLLTAAGAAQEATSGHPPDGLLSRWAMFWWVLGAAALAATLMLVGLNWWRIRWLRDFLANRPALPAAVVFFLVSVMTALVSVIFAGRSFDSRSASWIVPVGLFGSVVAVTLFALACGCVIGTRVSLQPRMRNSWTQWKKQRKALKEGALPARSGAKYVNSQGQGPAVFMVFMPNYEKSWRSLLPFIDRHSEQAGGKLGTPLTLAATWEVIHRGWPGPGLVQLRLELKSGDVVEDSASVLLKLAKVPQQDFDYMEDGGEVAITTKRRIRRASSPPRECFRLGRAHGLTSGQTACSR